MKIKIISFGLCGVFILVACIPATIPAPTKTALPSQVFTPAPQTLTPTPTIWWIITATPLNLPTGNNNEIVSAIDQIAPDLCVKKLHNNYALFTPPPEDVPIPKLRFIEVLALPEHQPGYKHERADNIDESYTAFNMLVPYTDENHDFGGSLYIVDNKTGKIFQVIALKTGATLSLGGLKWLNKDTLFYMEVGHAINVIIAVNVEKQRFEYFAYFYESPC
jgi:hypothetical protein